MSFTKIYGDSDELVKSLKKSLKPYKTLIKDNINRRQRFAILKIDKISTLNNCALTLRANGNHCDEDLDGRLKKICRKHYRQNDDSVITNGEPNPKKSKVTDSLIGLNLINDQNEDLDFEDGSITTRTNSTQPKKVNGFAPKASESSRSGSNGYILSDSNGIRDQISVKSLYGNNLHQNFKIPKKVSQNVETIVSHANSLTKRPTEAFTHLNKYLSEEQWTREDVIELLPTIAKNMVTFNEFGGFLNEFNQLMNKLKSLKYVEEDFWDDIIYMVDKKKSDIKNNHAINDFLSNLYEFMDENNISARLVCTEAVVIAYRTTNSHPTAKDLAELNMV